MSQNASQLLLQFSAVGLDKKVSQIRRMVLATMTHSLTSLSFLQDFLGKSDPYLEFAKQNPDGSFTPVHSTEVSAAGLDVEHLPWLPLE